MTTDFRALCAELAEKLDDLHCHYNVPNQSALIERARAALAEPEPEGLTPSDIELRDLAAHCVKGGKSIEWVILQALARWGNPVPAPPADGEVAELVAWLRRIGPCNDEEAANLNRAAELLERQALVPVPVSEQLPEPEDCAPWPEDSGASAWCWAGIDEEGGWNWEQLSADCLAMFPDSYTHWLPAHALPLPEVNNG